MPDQSTTPAFLIHARYVLDPGDTATFKGLAARMAETAHRRDGCFFLNAAQDVSDPNTFHLTEGWASQDAFNGHIGSPEFQSVLGEALRLRIVHRSGTMFLVAGRQELEMPS